VEITSPADGTGTPAGPIAFAGRAFDQSGSPVPAQSLAWSSSIDGPLGTGNSLTVATLSAGFHKITLTATAPGAQGCASIVLLIERTPATGQLGAYFQQLPGFIAGTPLTIPPTLTNMLDANPCDVNAISGNGALTAAFSRAGTLTVLRYPSPSYYNCDFYVASPGTPIGTGAIENMGVFAGLRVHLASGLEATTWFRDPTWKRAQKYREDDSAVVVTDFTSDALGLLVHTESFVHPTEDTLVQRFEISQLPGSPVLPDASVVYYEHLAPCTDKINYFPLRDVYFGWLNDYACGYHSGDDAILHFRPKNADRSQLDAFVQAPHANLAQDADAWLDAAGSSFGDGVYFALGSDGASSAFQCGVDEGGIAPATSGTRDAYIDASLGPLSGNPFAGARANAALARSVNLAAGAKVTFFLAAGTTPDGTSGSRARLQRARARAYTDLLADVESDWQSWVARGRMPQPPASARTIALAKRSLIVARTSTDKNTGAIVASVCTQLPYAEDWPRDGSFIDYALDLAGYPEIVEAHKLFYAKVQRTGLILPGSFDMNYYADGRPGGPVPFEIDEAALGVWGMASHAEFISDPAKKAAYLAQVYPAIKRGADLVAGWRDPTTGLQLPANEDDNILPTRGLHGATTIHAALTGAIAAGAAVGESPQVLAGWGTRRAELGAAIDRAYWDPARNAWYDTGNSGNPVGPHVQPTAWLIWPTQKDPFTDPRVISSGDYIFQQLDSVAKKQTSQSAYDAKVAVSLAYAFQGDPARFAKLRDNFHFFTDDLPTPDTLHVGEVYRLVNGSWTNLNDVPHVWEHMLIYHASVQLYP
jgi:hypothetical protein